MEISQSDMDPVVSLSQLWGFSVQEEVDRRAVDD
jgi:hypothetical protein